MKKIKIKRLREAILEKRGQVSLIVTFITMFLLFAAAFYFSNTSLKSLKVAFFTGDSSKSFYAAESGIEIFAYEKNYGALAVGGYSIGDILVCGCIAENNTYTIDIALAGVPAACVCASGDVDFNVYKIANDKVKSSGGYLGASRAVRVQW